MLELLEKHQPELLFREVRVDERQHDGLKREVPRCEPWVLPLIGHREDAHRVEMPPSPIAAQMAVGGWRVTGVVAVEPDIDVVQVTLLRPQETGESLTLKEQSLR